jgi:hypothetical protein
MNKLLNPIESMCSTQILLGSKPLIFSTYFNLTLLKWLANSSILFMFLKMKSPIFNGKGMNYFFLFSWKKCNQKLYFLATSIMNNLSDTMKQVISSRIPQEHTLHEKFWMSILRIFV